MSTPDLAAAKAVAVLMTDVSEGRLTAAAMADRAVQRCREVFAQCGGPADPLWAVHVEICRAVLGHGGLPASELAQWLAVVRNRENPAAAVDCPTGSVTSLSGPRGPDAGRSDDRGGASLKAVASQLDTVEPVDAMDDDEFADVPDDVLIDAEAAALAVIETYRQQREAGCDDQ